MTDTSRVAVERLAYLLSYPREEAPWRATCEEAAVTLRALAAERDAARAEAARLREALRVAETLLGNADFNLAQRPDDEASATAAKRAIKDILEHVRAALAQEPPA